MAEDTTRKGTNEQQQDSTKDAEHAKAALETGDRELSDADLDRVAGGAASEPLPAVRSQVRSL